MPLMAAAAPGVVWCRGLAAEPGGQMRLAAAGVLRVGRGWPTSLRLHPMGTSLTLLAAALLALPTANPATSASATAALATPAPWREQPAVAALFSAAGVEWHLRAAG